MDGNQLLARMKRLGSVETIKDVRPLTAAMFPGTHCPLMGAAMAAVSYTHLDVYKRQVYEDLAERVLQLTREENLEENAKGALVC